MKKHIFLIALLLAAACAVTLTLLPANAEGEIIANGTCGTNLTWTLDGNGKLMISGSGDMNTYIFSNMVPWNAYRNSICCVEIGEGVSSIGNYAFMECKNLTGVVLSDTVTSIGKAAFSSCTKLKYIFIPAATTSIETDAFKWCKLNHVFFKGPNPHYSVTQYSEYSHVDCLGNEMDGGTCSICNPPKGVIASGKCGENLAWLLDENGTLTISGSGEMREWEYGITAWSGLEDEIKYVVIEYGVTSITKASFRRCKNMICVSIPESVEVIGEDAFEYCESLTSVVIPGSVGTVPRYAFYGCKNLKFAIVSTGITRIYEYAFGACESLTSVVIPVSISSTEGYAIASGAFYSCNNLGHVLYTGAEEQWNQITIGLDQPALTTATRHYNCTGEEIVDGECTICYPPLEIIAQGTCGNNLTWTLDGSGMLTIAGEGPMENYNATSAPWYPYQDQIISLNIEAGVTSISKNVFYENANLKSVTLGEGITKIPDYAFAGCANLKEVSLPSTLNEIGNNAFNSCYKLIHMDIPDGVEKIGDQAFIWCSALQEVKFPTALQTMGYGAFNSCTSLTYAILPDGLSEIKWDVFSGCGKLLFVYIPESVTTIGQGAFYYCLELTHVLYGGTEAQWNNINISSYLNSFMTSKTRHYQCAGNEMVPTSTTLPTCTSGGFKTFTCSVCTLVYGVGTPALEHNYEKNVVFPNCTEEGYTEFTCSQCGDSYKESIVGAVGHSYIETVMLPTCTEQGYTTHSCVNCDESYVDNFVEGTGHDYEALVTEPTWQTGGYTTYTCANCGDSYQDDFTDPLPYVTGDVNGNNVVDTDDAIYLLYFTLFGEEGYPINQGCDFNGDGLIDTDDAIYLLYYTLFGGETYPLH